MATLTTIVKGFVGDGWVSDSQNENFNDSTPGLSGYNFRKPITYTAGSGAGTNYQVVVKCYYGSGTDGTETLNGETVAKVYLDQHCQVDFDDVRFALSGSSSAYVYKRTSKTDSDNAVFVFKVSDDMDTARVIYCYYGNAAATDESSDNALVDVITGVVLAMPLDEEDQEVDPIVIADDDQTAFWTLSDNVTLTNDTILKQDGIDCLKIVSTGAGWITHDYGVGNIQDWSSKNVLKVKWYGANTNDQILIQIYNTDQSKYFGYYFTDNFSGWRTLAIPFSSFTNTNSMAWNLVRYVAIESLVTGNTWYLDRFIIDTGIPAVDYSGNGNNGTATGTTVVDGKFVGKKARRFAIGDQIDVPTFSYTEISEMSFYISIFPDDFVTRYNHIFDSGWVNDGSIFVYYRLQNDSVFYVRSNAGVNSIGVFSSTLVEDAWNTLIGRWSQTYIKVDVNGTAEGSGGSNGGLASRTGLNIAGRGEGLQGIIGNLIWFNSYLTDAQRTNLRFPNYPDTRLVAGSVLVRKRATTTLPAPSTVGGLQRRMANLAFKINEITSRAEEATKAYTVATTTKGKMGVAVIVTEV